ncbi:MAG: hypothetical protein Q6370_006755, partial [Candidatus Sigynarchaeota archaeon]
MFSSDAISIDLVLMPRRAALLVLRIATFWAHFWFSSADHVFGHELFHNIGVLKTDANGEEDYNYPWPNYMQL